MSKPTRRSGGSEGGVFREDCKRAKQADHEHIHEQSKARRLCIGEIDIGAMIVQRMNEAKSGIWFRWMRRKIVKK